VTKEYEMMVIVSPRLNQEDAYGLNQKLLSIVTDNSGEIVKVDDWGKRILAYPINKVKEGYYYVDYFTLESTTVKLVKKQMNLNESIIRYMIINLSDKRRKNG